MLEHLGLWVIPKNTAKIKCLKKRRNALSAVMRASSYLGDSQSVFVLAKTFKLNKCRERIEGLVRFVFAWLFPLKCTVVSAPPFEL